MEGFQRKHLDFFSFFNIHWPIVLVRLLILPKTKKCELFRRADPEQHPHPGWGLQHPVAEVGWLTFSP